MGGAKTSVEVPRTTAEADGASETGTPDTVMAEPPAVIDCVPIANTTSTDVEFGGEPDNEPEDDPAGGLAEGLLIAMMAGIAIAVEPIRAVKEDDSCAEAGA